VRLPRELGREFEVQCQDYITMKEEEEEGQFNFGWSLSEMEPTKPFWG